MSAGAERDSVGDQRDYWDRVADRKTFTHPLHAEWLSQFLDPRARILDYGCGYGRTLDALASLGYGNTVGVDFSSGMITRGKHSFPSLNLRLSRRLPLAWADASFDAVLLLAVLTCIPDDSDQQRLIGEVRRLLRPGGLLYVSDMPLQSDRRNLARYVSDVMRFGIYGVFQTEDGAVIRHHDAQWREALFQEFEEVASRTAQLRTMNGHAATAMQFLVRRAPL